MDYKIILLSLIGINAYLFFAISKYSANCYVGRILRPLSWWNNLCKPCGMFWLCTIELLIVSIVYVNPFIVMLSFPVAVFSIIANKYLSI